MCVSEANMKISGMQAKSGISGNTSQSTTAVTPDFTKTEEVKASSSEYTIKSGTGKAGQLDAKQAGKIINEIAKAVKTRQYDQVKDLFTSEGFQMYTELIKYGKAKIIQERP